MLSHEKRFHAQRERKRELEKSCRSRWSLTGKICARRLSCFLSVRKKRRTSFMHRRTRVRSHRISWFRLFLFFFPNLHTEEAKTTGQPEVRSRRDSRKEINDRKLYYWKRFRKCKWDSRKFYSKILKLIFDSKHSSIQNLHFSYENSIFCKIWLS